MHSFPDDIKRLLDRAEECRTLAGVVGDASAQYLELADAYEALAEEERRLMASQDATASRPSARRRRSASAR
jgi:hypothetical protein